MNIGDMLEGYFQVPETLWDYIPPRSHIRFFISGAQPQNERFRTGGQIKDHFGTDGDKALRISTSTGGEFVVKYCNIESLWKKLNYDAFVELYMIYASLSEKQYQIKQILLRQNAMAEEIAGLKNILQSYKSKNDLK